ncbi:MAG: LCP family protein [Firmicutes bacterium]|nr:LCP family protein [Bacillota bacterium]
MATRSKRSGATIAGIVFLSILLAIVVVALAVVAYVYIRLGSIKKLPVDPEHFAEESFDGSNESVQETFETDSLPDDTSVLIIDDSEISWDVSWEENENSEETENSQEETASGDWLFSDSNITNIMLIGVDGHGYSGRSDTMILITLDRGTGEVHMTSFMRDLYVQIPGYSNNRLNAAYAFGGIRLMDRTFERNFGIHIDGHVLVNFDSFPQVINAMGGVDITLTQAEAEIVGVGGAGTYRLNGSQAMKYARIRKIDSDFSRTNRQRTLLNSLFKRMKKLGFTEMVNMANKVLNLVYTDMNANRILGLAGDFMSVGEIQQLRVPGNGEYYDAYIRKMMVLVPYLGTIHERLGRELYHK